VRSVNHWLASLALASALMAGCSSEPSNLDLPIRDPVHDTLIVPGDRIGPVYLGMPLRQVLEVMGDPQESLEWGQDGFSGMLYEWGDQFAIYSGVRRLARATLSVTVSNADQRVRVVSVGDLGYQTADGLRFGVSGARAVANLGSPAETKSLATGLNYCYRSGIHFGTDHTGTINWIRVFPPADYPISWCHRVRPD
jgi:hypothetical protein